MRAELDQLEALLTAYVAAGGLRLPRLELCITIVHVVPRNMLTVDYYGIKDVPPSSHWTRKLSWFYMLRFQELVEVVFFGDSRGSQRVLGRGCVSSLGLRPTIKFLVARRGVGRLGGGNGDSVTRACGTSSFLLSSNLSRLRNGVALGPTCELHEAFGDHILYITAAFSGASASRQRCKSTVRSPLSYLFDYRTTQCCAVCCSISRPATFILPRPELASGLSKRKATVLEKFSDVFQVREWTRRTMTPIRNASRRKYPRKSDGRPMIEMSVPSSDYPLHSILEIQHQPPTNNKPPTSGAHFSLVQARRGGTKEVPSDASQVPRAWARRSVAKYKKYISALLAIHNSIAPIDKLPTEIL